jgi:AcrR family transcriptional regulator
VASTRPYESPLRADQLEQTHAKILDAAIELVADSGPEALTIPLVAERAGASIRTVYRHFASKEALLEEISAQMEQAFDFGLFPRDYDQLPGVAPMLFRRFGENEKLVRAAVRTGGTGGAFGVARRRRIESLDETLRPLLAGRSRLERKRIVAGFYNLHSVRTWMTYRDNSGLSSEEAGQVVSWIVRALLADLKAGGTR